MLMVSGASLLAIAAGAAHAQESEGRQDAGPSVLGVEEIIVTARRREERLIDVPLTVNAVTGEDLAKLNIRQFEEIETVVPGLKLDYRLDGTGANASVRGIAFETAASGINGTIEFYLNDTPLISENLFPAMFDVGQIELLRGPQGTLRGRASPSGSITVTTRRPNLNDFGGNATATVTDIGGRNVNGAFNLPVVQGKFALRFAALYDENEWTRVKSVNADDDPFQRNKSGRVSARFEPTDALSFDLMYQNIVQKWRAYTQVESANLVDSTLPASPILIEPDDRRAVEDVPSNQRLEYHNLNWRAQWSFLGQRLNYAGSRNKRHLVGDIPADSGDLFNPAATPAFLRNPAFDQLTTHIDSRGNTKSHELRLSSEERVLGMFDYIIGAFQYKLESPTDIERVTPVIIPPSGGLVVRTPISRVARDRERSAFANLTAHIGEKLEVSGGTRYIDYKKDAFLLISGNRLPAADEDYDDNTWIYSGTIKYNFNDDLMVYFNTGSSWRAGISVVGDFNLARSELENRFLVLPPEKSKSYEIGLKGSALDRRLNAGLTLFYQKFKNYPYRSPTGVFFAETSPAGQRTNVFNFVAPVPVKVRGVEADVSFAATPQWDIAATVAYAKGKIQDGLIACNDYFPRDGLPDSVSTVPTFDEIRAITGDNLATCTVDYRASFSPLWSGTVQSEYRMPVTSSIDGYIRGLASLYGKSQNDPTNAVDDVSDYALLNLYLGLRDRSGAWEVAIYGKNITDTERVLSRRSSPETTPYNVLATSFTGVTDYRRITVLNDREFGLNVRYAWGSR